MWKRIYPDQHHDEKQSLHSKPFSRIKSHQVLFLFYDYPINPNVLLEPVFDIEI